MRWHQQQNDSTIKVNAITHRTAETRKEEKKMFSPKIYLLNGVKRHTQTSVVAVLCLRIAAPEPNHTEVRYLRRFFWLSRLLIVVEWNMSRSACAFRSHLILLFEACGWFLARKKLKVNRRKSDPLAREKNQKIRFFVIKIIESQTVAAPTNRLKRFIHSLNCRHFISATD